MDEIVRQEQPSGPAAGAASGRRRHNRARRAEGGLFGCADALAALADLRCEVRTVAEPPRRLPCRFGPYRLLRELGRGGSGTVYEAVRPGVADHAAVKVLLAGDESDAFRRRFRAEIQLLGKIHHPGVVRMLDSGEVNGHLYYEMELVDGVSLQERIDLGPVGEREAAARVLQIANVVAHLHALGVVHRDLKPTNVLLDGSGRPRVIDFGLARTADRTSQLTRMGDVLGTPLYMSPEQESGRSAEAGPPCDVFSLGMILCALQIGALPFAGIPGGASAARSRRNRSSTVAASSTACRGLRQASVAGAFKTIRRSGIATPASWPLCCGAA